MDLNCFIHHRHQYYYNLVEQYNTGWEFTKLLTQIRKICVTLGLKILRL